ncbi:MAG: nickel-dependent lactate racemase, partial [Acidobacteriota bacterium]|nr:nickel-dependent lactate racemase [Acidobacteriota bacterium]
MSTKVAPTVIGHGAPHSDMSPEKLRAIVEEALIGVAPGARVLAIIPDKTRDDNTDLLLPLAAEILAARGVAAFDALVAQGTHTPMTDAEKHAKVGARAEESSVPGLGQIFDHRWDDPAELATIGTLDAERVRELTGGLLNTAIPLTINRRLSPGVYDMVLIFGATVP